MQTKLQRVAARDVEPLLNACFPVGDGGSFFDDFPIWRDGAGVEWLAAVQSGQVVACAGWVPGLWQIPGRPGHIKVARVGGVATHSSLRGQGVGSALVEACIERARTAGREAVALWGVESPLYDRLGFKGRGSQVRVLIEGLAAFQDRVPGHLRLEAGFDDKILSLMKLARRQSGGVELTSGDLQWIRAHRNTKWVRVLDSDERVVAYGALGRGMDLGYQLHEWGAEDVVALQALPMVLRWAVEQIPQAELMGPRLRIEQLLGPLPESAVLESACMLLELRENAIPPDDTQIWFWGLDGV